MWVQGERRAIEHTRCVLKLTYLGPFSFFAEFYLYEHFSSETDQMHKDFLPR